MEMENTVRSWENITYTYYRTGKRTREAVVDSKDVVSNPSGFEVDCEKGLDGMKGRVQKAGVCLDETLNDHLRKSHVVERQHAHEDRRSIKEDEGIRSLSCILGSFPRRQRSKRGDIRKNVTKVSNAGFCGHRIKEKYPRKLHLKPRPRARRKRKSKAEADEISDSELTRKSSLSAFDRRGQSKRRANCSNLVSQQQGKLDTNVFQCYFENLWSGFSEEKRNSFAYLDCLWFSLYTKETSKTKVLNWIKKKDIFSKKYIFVPIVQWCHWSLLVFCHFGESSQSKARTPCMLLLDSLKMANPRRLEPEIRKFVLDIYKAQDRPENKQLIYKIPFLVPKVPQQRNGEECGNYVLYYINQFVESAPDDFSISEGYPYFMKEDWFTPEGLECFCKGLDS